MTRYIHVCTSHGVGLPALSKAASAEIFARQAEAQLAKGRIRPITTNVSRYVSHKSPALARALQRIFAAKRKAVALKVRAMFVDKLAKDTGRPTRVIASLIENLDSEDLGLDLEGELAPAMLAAFRRAAAIGATQVGLSMSGITDQVDEAAVAYAARRGGELIKDLAGTTDKDMRALLARAVQEGMSADELSTAVEGLGAFSDYRADMIARTELAYAHVQGNVEGWRAAGDMVVGKRSILSDLHDAPDECDEAAEAGTVPFDDDFVDGYPFPPYHPNACFEGASFASYGVLQQMVSSAYAGPAVTIVAELLGDGVETIARDADLFPHQTGGAPAAQDLGGARPLVGRDWDGMACSVATQRVEITIGPNHPMLTMRRGFVRAEQVAEGDELVHDSLADHTLARCGKSDLKEVMRFEDAFDALRATCGDTRIAGAARYLHGDEAFAYGEVDAVRPNGDLLPVLDPAGIEQLSKHDFVRADSYATLLARLRACNSNIDRVNRTTASRVRCGDDGQSLCDRHSRIPRFRRYRVVSCHRGSFTGRAFDASTLHGIYNAGGFVVKNCMCDIVPVLREDED